MVPDICPLYDMRSSITGRNIICAFVTSPRNINGRDQYLRHYIILLVPKILWFNFENLWGKLLNRVKDSTNYKTLVNLLLLTSRACTFFTFTCSTFQRKETTRKWALPPCDRNFIIVCLKQLNM